MNIERSTLLRNNFRNGTSGNEANIIIPLKGFYNQEYVNNM